MQSTKFYCSKIRTITIDWKILFSIWEITVQSPTPTHIYQHPPAPGEKRSHSPLPTHTQLKNITFTHTHTHTQPKQVIPTHTQQKKGHTHLNPAVNLWKRKLFIHWLIKYIRNSRSLKYNFYIVQCQTIFISIQYWTSDKSAAVINNLFRHILIKNYWLIICHLSHFHLTSSYNIFFPTSFITLNYFCCHIYYFMNCA